MTGPVLAVAEYSHNGALIAAAHKLGHLRDGWTTLDVTAGNGVFWKTYRPPLLVCCDLEPKTALVRKADFRDLPFEDESFGVVVLDPPYGLRGSVNETNGGYGLEAGYMSVEARYDMIREGIAECARVAQHRLILKCQDQVVSGQVSWQTRLFADHAEEKCGLRLVERLDMLGGSRPQPARTRADGKPSVQQHAYQRPSTLLVFAKGRS